MLQQRSASKLIHKITAHFSSTNQEFSDPLDRHRSTSTSDFCFFFKLINNVLPSSSLDSLLEKFGRVKIKISFLLKPEII